MGIHSSFVRLFFCFSKKKELLKSSASFKKKNFLKKRRVGIKKKIASKEEPLKATRKE